RRVVLVAEAGKMMAELVNEDVFGEAGIDGGGRLIVEDASSAVLLLVHEDLEELVRRRGCDVAQRTIVEREHVALGIEDVVLRADRGAAIVARSRPVDAALRGRHIDRAYVEVLLPGLERLGIE